MRSMMNKGKEAANDAGQGIKSGFKKAKKGIKEGVRDFKKGWNEQEPSEKSPSTYQPQTL